MRKQVSFILVIVMVMGLLGQFILVQPQSTVAQGTIQVNVNDSKCVSGSGQSNPYNVVYCSIQDAIDDAANNDTVMVAAGTYNENIYWDSKDLDITGAGKDVTIVDGGGTDSVFTVIDLPSNSSLQGFTITNGYNPKYGGGISNSDSDLLINDCLLINNSSGLEGGGIFNVSDSSPTLTNCVFYQNSSGSYGGGLYNHSSSPVLTNCTFFDNDATSDGSGLGNYNSSPQVTNCIFWGDYDHEIHNNNSSPTITYCDIDSSSLYPGTGNMNKDPMFASPPVGDVHLEADSPCIDTGNNSAPSIPKYDFDGDKRSTNGNTIPGAVVDIGADEFINTPPSASNLDILPSSPYPNENLIGDYDYYDFDGHSEDGTQIRWYRNTVYQAAYDDTLFIPSSATDELDTWYFTIKPFDGIDYGNTETSPTVYVADIMPSIVVSKTADPTAVDEPGGNVTFNFSVQNTTPVEGVTLTSLTDDIYGDLDGQGSCSLPQFIPLGGQYNCSCTKSVNGDGGDSIINTVTASAQDNESNVVQEADSATVNINDLIPEVTVQKTANPPSVPEPGGSVVFDVAVCNESTVESVTLTSLVDDIYGNLDGLGDCTVPQAIPPDGCYTCSFEEDVLGNGGDSQTDTVTATLEDDEFNVIQEADSATVDITDVLPEISVVKNATPDSIWEPSGLVTYTVQVNNDSTVEELTLTSLMDDIFGDLNGEGNCAVPQSIDPGDCYACQFSEFINGNAGDVHINTVTATAEDDEANIAQEDDSASVTINDMEPYVEVIKTASPNSVEEPGGEVTFTIDIDNMTDEEVELISLVDDIHGDLDGQGTCELPVWIPAQDTYTCQFTVVVSGDVGEETDIVTAGVQDDELNYFENDDSETVTITDVLPSISVFKNADPPSVFEPGGTVTFTVEVHNNSVEDVRLMSLMDDVFGDLDCPEYCKVQQTIIPGNFYTCEFDAFVSGNAFDVHQDTVTATAEDNEFNTVQEYGSALVDIMDVLPSISVTKTGSPTSVPESGGLVTFHVRVDNTSPDETVTLTSLIDDIHGNLDRQGDCVVPQAINAGECYECDFSALVSGNAGDNITDTITATAEDDEMNPVQEADSATVTVTDVLPSISVTKDAVPETVYEPGDTVTFDVRVDNTSPDESVTLTSLIDDVHGNLDGQGDCSIPQLISAGECYMCSFEAMVSGNANDVEIDIVTATAEDDESNQAQNVDGAEVTVLDVLPSISVTKDAVPDTVMEPGDTVTFDVRVDNTSPDESVTLTSLIDDVHGNLNGQGDCSIPQVISAGECYMCSFEAMVTGNANDVEIDIVTATAEDDELYQAQDQDGAIVTITDVLPSINVIKTASPTSVWEPGGTVTFSLFIENLSMAEEVTITDITDDIYGSLNGASDCGMYTEPVALPPGGNCLCEFERTVSGNAGTSQTDTVDVTARDDEYNYCVNSGSATVDIVNPYPEVETNLATGIAGTSATLNGTLIDLGTAASVDVYFEYGTLSGSYPYSTVPDSTSTTGPFSDVANGLTPDTTYYFHAVADGDMTAYGEEESFTTVYMPVHNTTRDTWYFAIQSAINDANSGDTIVADAGTYNENLVWNIDLIIYGAGADVTTIDGGGSGGAIVTSGLDQDVSMIQGFTITKGVADNGGGMYNNGSSPNVVDCIISDNSANLEGGGIYNDSGSAATFMNCMITGNVATYGGGGIYNKSSAARFINCTVSNNTGIDGGGMYSQYCTPVAKNCIFWGNSAGQISGGATVSYSDVQDGYTGTENIDGDPLFLNAGSGNFHLTFDSPCIDSGTNSALPPWITEDYEGDSRIFDGDYDDIAIIDMGADEGHFVSPIVTTSTVTDVTGTTATLNGALTRLGTADPVDIYFEYGTASGSYPFSTTPVSASGTGPFSEGIASLTPDTTYYVRAVADGDGTVYGNEENFATLFMPVHNITQDTWYSTIQSGIDDANLSDTLVVAAGTYIENLAWTIDLIVQGAGADVTMIDGGGSGGAIVTSGLSSTSKLEGFTIQGGQANSGGGIYNDGSSLVISDCRISGNIANQEGGGIYNKNSSSPTLTNCIIMGNTAAFGGGGMFNHTSAAEIINCTFYGNTAADGGGMYNQYCTPIVTNCILWGDTPGEITGSADVTYSDVQGDHGGTGNISGTPMFENPLASNFHLLGSSPCIDKGSNTSVPAWLTTDFEGDSRIIDGDAVPGAVVDMGVDEFVPPPGVTVGIKVNLQGTNRPPNGWQVPINIGFFTPGANVLVDTPLKSFTGTTTAISTPGGTRAYFLCPDPITPDTYDITVDSTTTLLNVKRNVGIW